MFLSVNKLLSLSKYKKVEEIIINTDYIVEITKYDREKSKTVIINSLGKHTVLDMDLEDFRKKILRGNE